MKDFPVSEQGPAEVGQGREALKDAQPELTDQPHSQRHAHEAVDERLQKARATQREFVIRLYVTSAIVIVVLSFAIYLMMRLS